MILRLHRERKRIGRPPRKRIAGRRENGSAESRRDRTRLGVGTRHVMVRGAGGNDEGGIAIIVFFLHVGCCWCLMRGGVYRQMPTSPICPSLYIGAFARESEPLARKKKLLAILCAAWRLGGSTRRMVGCTLWPSTPWRQPGRRPRPGCAGGGFWIRGWLPAVFLESWQDFRWFGAK